MEEWKSIKDFEDYQVSSLGRIRSFKWGNERIRKANDDTRGYLTLQLCKAGKSYQRKIHRLVAETFLERPANATNIDHIDRNKANNVVNNLRWVTHSVNTSNVPMRKNNRLGEKNIYMNSGMFCAEVRRDGVRSRKYCKTLEEAKTWRDENII